MADLRKATYAHILSLDPAFFLMTRTGEVLSRLTADTTLIQTVVGSSVSVALRNLVSLTGGLVLMFVSSLKLALLVVGAVVLVMLPMLLFGRWVRKLSRTSQDRIADSSARASETLNAVQTVQAFTRERDERTAFAGTVDDGWFRTGDLAERSADGYYSLRGRASDLIISGGFNIYPREIEELLLDLPTVTEAAVVYVRVYSNNRPLPLGADAI